MPSGYQRLNPPCPSGYYLADDEEGRSIWLEVRFDRVARVYHFDPRPRYPTDHQRIDDPNGWGYQVFQGPADTFQARFIWQELDEQHTHRLGGEIIPHDRYLHTFGLPRSAAQAWHYIHSYGGLILDAVQVQPVRNFIGIADPARAPRFPAWADPPSLIAPAILGPPIVLATRAQRNLDLL